VKIADGGLQGLRGQSFRNVRIFLSAGNPLSWSFFDSGDILPLSSLGLVAMWAFRQSRAQL